MKVLHVVRQYRPSIGGMESFVESLALHLKQKGIDSDVLTLDREFATGNKLPTSSIENGINVTRIPYVGSKKYPVALSSISYLSNYDLIHVHAVDFFIDYFTWFKAIHKKPIVLSTHGGFFHTQDLVQFKKVYFQTMTRMSLMQADRILACSINDYELFQPLGKRKTEIIENGIDFDAYHRVSHVKKQRNRFLFVGRFSQNKRIDKLVTLIHLLKDENPDIRLCIVGKDFDNLKDGLLKKIAEYELEDYVSIRESLPNEELLEEMGKAEYFISASAYEGFGMSALEAMSSGAIPILSDIPSFKKMVDHGKNGYVLDFTDVRSAALHVNDVIKKSNKNQLKQAAIETARNYSWASVVNRFEKVYRDTIEQSVVHQ
ncbi:glycosyltransferase family 4 protein [Alkalihalobacillus sp. CinArs1]|uniref:glycosyltransferase family 4 protein n=1 Tax=Alkalihalobacillus sp. CinArs1 TaxID=2995314 RepID=UPI0022DE7819|nr:glycosyltransferase family 4 protein [Alkalihalobacillus sp. CinArs1]